MAMLGAVTQAAIEDYQVEETCAVTGAIDRPLLISLGFSVKQQQQNRTRQD
jgi:hypothetical protein